MMRDRVIYVAQRAYELAASGEYLDIASIQTVIVAEGFADEVGWLEGRSVRDDLQIICRLSRERRPATRQAAVAATDASIGAA
jgi:hypothetical protein